MLLGDLPKWASLQDQYGGRLPRPQARSCGSFEVTVLRGRDSLVGTRQGRVGFWA